MARRCDRVSQERVHVVVVESVLTQSDNELGGWFMQTALMCNDPVIAEVGVVMPFQFKPMLVIARF